LFVIAFARPLPAGTSGDALSDFNPAASTIDFGGGAAKRNYPIAFRALVMVPGATAAVGSATYDVVGQSIAGLAGADLYDGTQDAERDRLVANLSAVFAAAPL